MKLFIVAATFILTCSLVKADIVSHGNTEVVAPDAVIHGMTEFQTDGISGNRHGGGSVTQPPPSPIPEPATALLLGLSLIGAGMVKRRAQRC
jgi:hypothetical protein